MSVGNGWVFRLGGMRLHSRVLGLVSALEVRQGVDAAQEEDKGGDGDSPG